MKLQLFIITAVAGASCALAEEGVVTVPQQVSAPEQPEAEVSPAEPAGTEEAKDEQPGEEKEKAGTVTQEESTEEDASADNTNEVAL